MNAKGPYGIQMRSGWVGWRQGRSGSAWTFWDGSGWQPDASKAKSWPSQKLASQEAVRQRGKTGLRGQGKSTVCIRIVCLSTGEAVGR